MVTDRLRGTLLASGAVMACVTAAPAAAQSPKRDFNVAEQPANTGIPEFARQADVQILVSESLVKGRTTRMVRGRLPIQQALERLLKGTGLSIVTNDGRTFTLTSLTEAPHASDTNEGVPEILVVGNRSQNVDIRRTEDDTQPYVVFDAEEISRSQATNMEDFLRQRLPQNAAIESNAQSNQGTSTGASPALGMLSAQSNTSSVDLRGLGAAQTLILIDGRRPPRYGAFSQSDINAIPLSTIQRIEVLPSSAGAIYGGGAVGGVINIIRKRDYDGMTLSATRGGTFRGGGEESRIEVGGGFSPDGGTTQFSFSGSYATTKKLRMKDNDLWRRSRDRYFEFNAPREGTVFVPISSLPNIASTTGAELILDNGTPLNSPVTHVPAGYAGAQTDAGAALVVNAGSYDKDLAEGINGRDWMLRNGPKVMSANLNMRREFAPWLDFFSDLSWSKNQARAEQATLFAVILPASAANNPFQQPVRVTLPNVNLALQVRDTITTLNFNAGFIARIGKRWTGTVEYVWGRATSLHTVSSQDPFARVVSDELRNGAANPIRDLVQFPIDFASLVPTSPEPTRNGPATNTQETVSTRLAGSPLDLPAGRLEITALLEKRREVAKAYQQADPLYQPLQQINPRSQSVESVYAEVRIPIFSKKNSIPLLRELELQGSIRHDRYKTMASDPEYYSIDLLPVPVAFKTSRQNATSYFMGGRWSPLSGVSFRASYSTGFLPPAIDQIVQATYRMSNTPDPRRGGTVQDALFDLRTGGNPELKAERSQSLSFGVVLAPAAIPDLRLSLDYSRIHKNREIGSLSEATVLALQDAFPDRVKRGELTEADRALGYTGGPIEVLDVSLLNITKSRVRSWDFQASYAWKTERLGEFNFYLIGTYQPELKRQVSPDAAPFEMVGFRDGVLRWRGNAGLDWHSGGWRIGWNAQYYHSYSYRISAIPDSEANDLAIKQQGRERIPSQIYHDLAISYRFPEKSNKILSGTEILFGVQNVFDKRPPAYATPAFGTMFSSYGDVRLRRYTLTLRKEIGV